MPLAIFYIAIRLFSSVADSNIIFTMTDILLVVGTNIRKIRKDFGWTQADLAEKSGISVPFMTQIELGRKSASLEVIQSIASALNVSYQQLFMEQLPSQKNSQNLANFEQTLKLAMTKTLHEEFLKLQL